MPPLWIDPRPRGVTLALRCVLLVVGLSLIPNGRAAGQVRVTFQTVSEGAPVEGAQINVGPSTVLTDVVGEVRLQLAIGSHEVQVARIGYSPVNLLVTLLTGADTTVVVELTEQAIETEGIVVVSSRTERRVEDEPLRIEVVSREEVEEKQLMTPGDISMLLNETAGLRVQPTAPSLGGASVRIQGLRGRYTQILSDGLPLYGGQAGALGPLQIPPMDLGQVEVIKGAASALYGSTALGGVVNLISRRPEDERELLLNQTTLGGTDAVLWLARESSDRWGHTLLASVNRQGQADVDEDGWADLPGYRRAVLRPRVFWNDGSGGSVFFTAGGMIEDREGGTVEGGTTPAGTPFTESLDTRRLDIGVVGRKLIQGSRLLSVRGSAMGQTHRHGFGDVSERDKHLTAFTEVSLTGQDGDHAWVVGAALQHDQYDAEDVPAFDFTYTVPALLAQEEYAISPWLSVSGSARLDFHSEYGSSFNPRLSVLVRPGEWVIRASAGTGYFPPSPFVEETEAVGLSVLEPYQDLKVEKARSVMADVGRAIGSWELNAAAFASEIEDAIAVRQAPGGRLELFNSADPVRTWGTEFLVRFREGPLFATATYVYTRSRETDPEGTSRREVPLTPSHTIGVIGGWESEGRGRVGAEFYYTGKQTLDENPYRSVSKPYVVVGVIAERRFGRVRVFVNAENMLDTRHTRYDRLVRPSRSPEGRWTTDVWAPLEGVAINGGVRLEF